MLLLLISPVFPVFLYASAPVGMAKTQTSPKEQAIAKVVRKLRESEKNEVIGSVLNESFVDNEDFGDTACGNRYPGWPGTSVFRMLILAKKVGAIIGHRGERVRRLCEETKACVRIIGGHLCSAEHLVSCPLNSYLATNLGFSFLFHSALCYFVCINILTLFSGENCLTFSFHVPLYVFSRTCRRTAHLYIKKKLRSKIDQYKPPEGGKHIPTTHPLLYHDLVLGYSNP
jgi:hypothetical protein